MNAISSKWPVVDSVAERLGVKVWTRHKWRQRGSVPSKWLLPLIENSGGELTLGDFAEATASESDTEQARGTFTASVVVKVGAGGRVVLPASMRAAMGVAEGDDLVLRCEDGVMTAMSRATALRKAQELVRKYIPEGTAIVDEFIAEKRAEAARE